MDEWIANDRTRKLFRNAVVEMFGGEAKIPASVRKAMLLVDYDEGKPLTARRIMAVKNAIDRDGSLGGLFHEWHGIVFDSKQGRQAILAKQVVDCTGGADVCFAAGANYRQITPVRLC